MQCVWFDARFRPELPPELGHPGNLAGWKTDRAAFAINVLFQLKIESCVIDEISTSLNRPVMVNYRSLSFISFGGKESRKLLE